MTGRIRVVAGKDFVWCDMGEGLVLIRKIEEEDFEREREVYQSMFLIASVLASLFMLGDI